MHLTHLCIVKNLQVVFLSDLLRDVTPFEAYVISKEALKTVPAMYSIGGAGGDTPLWRKYF